MAKFGMVLLFAALILQLAGCDGSRRRAAIKGTVTYQGVAVKEGTIAFDPADPQKTKEGGVIVDGKYSISAENGLFPGQYKVSISARDTSGAKPDDSAPGAPKRQFKELLPEEYNTKTNLSIEVAVGGVREFNFDLK